MFLFNFFSLITIFFKIQLHKNRKKPGNRIGIARLFSVGICRCGVWQVIPPARRHKEDGRCPRGFHT